MLKEILENTNEEMEKDQEVIYKQLEIMVLKLDNLTKKASKLPEGKRLKKELDKIGGLLYDEMEFVGRGEYN